MNGDFSYGEPWLSGAMAVNPIVDPTFLLPLPYLQATQYPGFNPIDDINNEDLSLYEPFDDPNFLPMGAGAVVPAPVNPILTNSNRDVYRTHSNRSRSAQPQQYHGDQATSDLDVPLIDSRVSYTEEPEKIFGVNGHSSWDDEKENISDAGSEGLDLGEKTSRSVPVNNKKNRKELEPRVRRK